MAKYYKYNLTSAGINMIGLSQGSGAALTFTGIQIGDGQLADGDDIKTFTALKNPLLLLPVSECKQTSNGKVTITAVVDNSNVTSGFFAREIGVMAKVGTGATQLYYYAYAGNYCDYYADKNTPIEDTKIIIELTIGSVENVTAVVDSTVLYATKAELSAHMTDPAAHKPLFTSVYNTITADVSELKALIERAKKDAILAAHPVGSYFQSDVSTSPATLFGGTWAEVHDVMLLASGKYGVGVTGGNYTHTLTVAELPSHNHNAYANNVNISGMFRARSNSFYGSDRWSNTLGNEATSGCFSVVESGLRSEGNADNNRTEYIAKFNSDHSHNISVTSVGGNAAINMLPPFRSVYMWKRTA